MSIPPARISIKRRRQEEPVEALYLHDNQHHNQKRRFTDYYFKRLRDECSTTDSSNTPQLPSRQQISDRRITIDSNGIPTVRPTLPGDEVEDFKKLRAAQKARSHERDHLPEVISAHEPTSGHATNQASSKSAVASLRNLQHARRFHLARSLSSFYRPDSSGGIRKPASKVRSVLPTFIERQTAIMAGQEFHAEPPIDRLLQSSRREVIVAQGEDTSSRPTSDAAGTTATFFKSLSPPRKLGTSIRDHPSTWDTDSDQLADELAALAMEIEPVSHAAPVGKPDIHQPTATLSSKPDVEMRDGDFIYETYIRAVHQNDSSIHPTSTLLDQSFGVLVIDEEDEALWQTYMEEDEDSECDEEDSNAEENPANDYPDEEVSSDDEFDRGAYNYRHYASDDEQYGDEGDED